MQRSQHFCLLVFLLSAFFFSNGASSQSINPLHIPDTLLGPVFNMVIDESQHPFLPGVLTQTKAFNGRTFLGPTLIMRRGWEVEATINNNLDDTTTVHWHGLHISAHADGGPHSPILPGQQWNPHFTCLDKASTYWYHPHFHGKTGRHTLQGAAGMILVRDAEEALLNLPRRYGVDDFPLIIQSLEFDPNNQIDPKGTRDSVILVNGTLKPFLNVPAQHVRFRVVNASNARNFNLGLPFNVSFQLIGTDGGLLGKPLEVTRVRLAPGERAEFLINFQSMQGQSISFKSYGSEIPTGTQGGPVGPLPPGTPSMKSPLNGADFELIEFRVAAPTSNPITTIPDSLAAQTRIEESEATEFRTIRFSSSVPNSVIGPFLINDSSYSMTRIDFKVPVGNTEIWTIRNQTPVAHPFHLHGFQFYVLDRFGGPVGPEEMGRKDVVLVGPNEELRIIARFTDFADTTMPYMYHCHLLTHEDEGMMGQFVVKPLISNVLEWAEKRMEIIPNPFTDRFQMRADIKSGEEVFVYDFTGKLVWRQATMKPIITAHWKPGVYLIRSGSFSKKIMKLQ